MWGIRYIPFKFLKFWPRHAEITTLPIVPLDTSSTSKCSDGVVDSFCAYFQWLIGISGLPSMCSRCPDRTTLLKESWQHSNEGQCQYYLQRVFILIWRNIQYGLQFIIGQLEIVLPFPQRYPTFLWFGQCKEHSWLLAWRRIGSPIHRHFTGRCPATSKSREAYYSRELDC